MIGGYADQNYTGDGIDRDRFARSAGKNFVLKVTAGSILRRYFGLSAVAFPENR